MEKFVFAQICSFLPPRAFDTIVSKYGGDYRVRHFTCWYQMLCMMYGQFSNRDSVTNHLFPFVDDICRQSFYRVQLWK